MADDIHVEVAYALPHRQKVVALKVPAGTTMLEAAKLSGLADTFEGLNLDTASMGIFGKVEGNPAGRALKDGERVEIYRPLKADPKETRKARAMKAKAARSDQG